MQDWFRVAHVTGEDARVIPPALSNLQCSCVLPLASCIKLVGMHSCNLFSVFGLAGVGQVHSSLHQSLGQSAVVRHNYRVLLQNALQSLWSPSCSKFAY